MAKKQKYYVVWQGKKPGIYTDWDECKEQVVGVQSAQYKSFDTMAEAEAASRLPYSSVVQSSGANGHNGTSGQSRCLFIDENGMTAIKPGTENAPMLDALAVDAACSGNPGVMEYQGIYIPTRASLVSPGFRSRAWTQASAVTACTAPRRPSCAAGGGAHRPNLFSLHYTPFD